MDSPSIPLVDSRRRRRAMQRAAPALTGHAELLDNLAELLVQRLDLLGTPPRRILELGRRTPGVARALARRFPGVCLLTHSDGWPVVPDPAVRWLVADAAALPLQNGCVDTVLHAMDLHWQNEPERVLAQVRRVLAPDGVYLGSVMGERSLMELRESAAAADHHHHGRVWPRVRPGFTVTALGDLLVRAGLSRTVVDVERMELWAPSPAALRGELQRFGAGNHHAQRAPGLAGRRFLAWMDAYYRERFARPDGKVQVSVEILFAFGRRSPDRVGVALPFPGGASGGVTPSR
ncbi:MAG: methyltransferase domain-containing protein [Magnetococcus sp. WYHC-3]